MAIAILITPNYPLGSLENFPSDAVMRWFSPKAGVDTGDFETMLAVFHLNAGATPGRSRVQKTFSTTAHGEAGAFHLAMQMALDAASLFGGEEAAQIFVRDYMEKFKRLPKKGVSARIRFMPVEDSKKAGHCQSVAYDKRDASIFGV